ncbi:TadE/TadG family type IV pilus assembly protein [Pseudogulbenkiania sp. MAI-1]|uniref:TadE/TadG family type IV pilus assembly protein n=1 Tax=Pseudogulbenkiania sp. MAI-1 TaxID=990370 RepID=UPI00045E6A89|nr:TadE/TadG family type IV pilus assembly protein [Pseudogulbenkiania sp. MAI-1]
MRRYSKERGVAAVEMAFLLMPLIFIVFGITEFGRAFYQYNTIVKATRDAARYLSAQQAGTKDAVASCLVRYGNYSACLANPSYTGPLLAPGLDTATITVCDWPRCADHNAQGTAPVVNLVSVTVSNYQFVSLVPFVTADMATITFDDIRTTMKANL